jgi:four helix bundle protein
MRICRGTCCEVVESSSLQVVEAEVSSALHTSSLFRVAETLFAPIDMANSFRRLFVWEASIELAVRIIHLADRLIARKRFAIADQIVRAALSVPSNIAEGQGRSSTRDRRHFLVQARGSLYELETQLEILARARLARDTSGVMDAIKQISCGLTRMIDRLGQSPSTTRRLDDSTPSSPSS